MAMQLFVAHTGQQLQLDTSRVGSLDELKALASRETGIPAQNIIILTPQGKPVKLQTVLSEREIYLYDNRITQPSPSASSSTPKTDVPSPREYVVSSPPEATGDRSSLATWQQLFKAQRTWAAKIVDECTRMAESAQDRYGEMDVMMRCLDAALANLESVVNGLQTKYTDLRAWIPTAQADYSSLVTGWEQYLSLARSIPISAAMARFMTGQEVAPTGRNKPSRIATLEDLIDLEIAKKASRSAPAALRKFNTRAADLDKSAGRLSRETEALLRDFEGVVARSTMSHQGEPAQLLGDIEALAKKLEADYQTSLESSTSTRDVLQASKIAASHADRILPSVRNRALEMDEMLRYATQARNALSAESIEFMRSITDITSLSSTVKSQIGAINQEDEMTIFDHLRLIQQVPYVYASFVTEAIKRREWFEKIRTDSSTLANEMALFQDEEMKRRRKWHKSVGETFGPDSSATDNTTPGLEVNLLGDEDQWPTMARKDLEELYSALQRQKADAELVSDVGKLIAELNSPTKQQSKRLKAFKHGSMHEATLGRSGLMIRGDDDLWRALQDDKTKLESKLKTAESRVRRLEDLLHRQSQSSRPNLGNMFQMPSQQLDSGSLARSPRASEDRRRSLDGTDQLVQRIQQLEGQLSAERERSAVFEKDLTMRMTQHKDMKGQVDEVNSTKKDLLENMEALKREFMEERKSLEDEVKRLQSRIEDTEDEIEHFGESRENEKASYDEKVQALEREAKRLQTEKNDEALKAQGQVDFLRKEARRQRELVEALESQLRSSNDEARALTKRLDAAAESGESKLKALQDMHANLTPEAAIPADLQDLIEAVMNGSTDLLTKLRALDGDMALLRSELDEANRTERELRGEIASQNDKLSDRESAAIQLRENLSEERAKAAALEGELANARGQASELRIRIADGETGSEALRKQLEDSEKRIGTLTEELASRQSQVGSLEEELRLFRDRMNDTQSRLAELQVRFDSRSGRAKDLTQRLYSQNDRLCRLLVRLGFSYTREGGSMVIQKVPRSERSPANSKDAADPASSLRRSGSLSSHVLGDSGDLDLLYWMNNTADADAESGKYESFLTTLGAFDMDAFSEAVYRRVKEVEHLARKLQRDSRAYREKTHVLQKEAHDKMAFKNFKEGDLALFLPTRNQTTGAWAAFNVGFPHYFLREQEAHRLGSREWLLARISGIQERVVDLSRSLQAKGGEEGPAGSRTSASHEADSVSEENDNPFDLSDGLRWYLIDAHEDKPGAPTTPGPAKSTVAANNVEATAEPHSHLHSHHSHGRAVSTGKAGSLLGGGLGIARAAAALPSGIEGVSKSLSKSLESRRSSTGSRKALPFAIGGGARGRDSALASETNSLRAAAAETPVATSPTQPHGVGHASTAGAGAAAPLSGTSPLAAGAQSADQPGEQEADGPPAAAAAADDGHTPAAATSGQEQQNLQGRHLNAPPREASALSQESQSPSKKSVVWDALWSLDLGYDSGRKGGR